MMVLFANPSGTGKTLAAPVLAKALGRDLLRSDLAAVVNKYLDETEKHLKVLFDAAERSGVVLFFDEADALFSKRTEVKDAHDRYADFQIEHLLRRVEQFVGTFDGFGGEDQADAKIDFKEIVGFDFG